MDAELYESIKSFDKNALIYYKHLLSMKKANIKFICNDLKFISLKDILNIISENFTILESNENLIDILEILHYTILLPTAEAQYQNTIEVCNNFFEQSYNSLNNKKDISLLLHFSHQILTTLSQIEFPESKKNEYNFFLTEQFGKIINYLFDGTSNNKIYVRGLFCITILIKAFDSKELLTKIWNKIINETYTNQNMEILCFLSEKFINLCDLNNEQLWKFLYNGLKIDNHQSIQKHIIFVLKTIIKYLSESEKIIIINIENLFEWNTKNIDKLKNAWSSFFTIYENIQEKQSHLILSSVKLLWNTDIISKWKNILISELLKHQNTLVLKWAINYIIIEAGIDDDNLEIFPDFLLALNHTFLYSENDINFDKSIQLKSIIESNMVDFIKNFHLITKTIPIHVCLTLLADIKKNNLIDKDIIDFKFLINISSIIRQTQNKIMRENMRTLFFQIFLDNDDYAIENLLNINEYFLIIETLYNKHEKINDIGIKITCQYIIRLNYTPGENLAFSFHAFMVIANSFREQLAFIALYLLTKPSIDYLLKALSLNTLDQQCCNKFAIELIKAIFPSKDFDEMMRNENIFKALCKLFNETSQTYDERSFILHLIIIRLLKFENGSDNQYYIYDGINLMMVQEKYQNIKKDLSIQYDRREAKQIFIDILASTLSTLPKLSNIVVENIECFIEQGSYTVFEVAVNALWETKCIVNSTILERMARELISAIKKYAYESLYLALKTLIKYIARSRPKKLHEISVLILDSDPTRIDLAAVIFSTLNETSDYDQEFFFETPGMELLIRGLLYGEPVHGDQKTEYDYSRKYRINTLYNDSYEVRLNSCNILYRIWNNEDISLDKKLEFHSKLTDRLIPISCNLNKNSSRYFANSKQHRLKLRLVQTLAILHGIQSYWDERFLIPILKENNQNNVTFISEMIIAETIDPKRMMELLKKVNEYSNSSVPSIFTIGYMVCRKHNNKELAAECITELIPFTMGQYFNIRLYAQIAIIKLVKIFKLQDSFKYLVDGIMIAIKQGNGETNLTKLNEDFRYNQESYENILDAGNILKYIPQITGMASDELYYDYKLKSENDLYKKLEKISISPIMKKSCSKVVENTTNSETFDDAQRKMNPSAMLLDPGFLTFSEGLDAKKTNNEMIVIASLIDKLPNLGGIARTCEVLGIKNLILESLKYVENKEFKTLSMTAEKWLNIKEIKPNKLESFINEKKSDGYSIVGAEQTANSCNFMNFQFPKRVILLLGHEKEGIPSNLIPLLDFAVEIPQHGMVRSLNVHVTGALFMWEYFKQHLQ